VAAPWVVEAVEAVETGISTTTSTTITADAVDAEEAAVDARTRGRAMVLVVVVGAAADAAVRRGFDEKISCERISSTSDRYGD